jgi:hypothetical protein
MPIVMKMFGGMFVLGGVAATDVAAGHTHPQVNPGVADLYAIFADMLVGRRDFDLIQMLAFG